MLASDRFAAWPRGRALLALVAWLAMLLATALTPITAGPGAPAKPVAPVPAARPAPRDADLQLYDTAVTRIRHGENYYHFILAEQRLAHYPVRPGLSVRLPTLAYLDAALGVNGAAPAPLASAVAVALLLALLAAWWFRLGEEPCSPRQRRFGVALLLLGASLGLNRTYFVLHELWAGQLLALSFGLHRPERGKWRAAWGAAALALAIRELALPFVLLAGATALWHRRWREAGAWAALVALFAAGLAWHLHLVAARVLPSDAMGPSWFALRGLRGWLSDIALSSNLRFLPPVLAGPAMLAMLLGWAGWRSPAGAFGTLLFLGYGLAFMVAGRDNNFYWGAVIAPAMFIGLAFAPMAFLSLARAALMKPALPKPPLAQAAGPR